MTNVVLKGILAVAEMEGEYYSLLISQSMPTCLTLCSSLVYVKGEELCVGVSATSGEET